MKQLVNEKGMGAAFDIASAATSREEIGSDTHAGTRRVLTVHGVPFTRRAARQLTKADYEEYDYLIGMETYNIKNMMRLLGGDPDGKMSRLLDFTDRPRDIDDPWYTGRFEDTYREVTQGCEALFRAIRG